jgi:hypothetical protein
VAAAVNTDNFRPGKYLIKYIPSCKAAIHTKINQNPLKEGWTDEKTHVVNKHSRNVPKRV